MLRFHCRKLVKLFRAHILCSLEYISITMGIQCSCTCAPAATTKYSNGEPITNMKKRRRTSHRSSRSLRTRRSISTSDCDFMQDITGESDDNQNSIPLQLKNVSIRDIDNERIEAIISTPTLLQLEDRISCLYDTDYHLTDYNESQQESDYNDESSESDPKRIELSQHRHRASICSMKAFKGEEGWEQKEMDDLAYQYKQELSHLTKRASKVEIDILCKNKLLSGTHLDQLHLSENDEHDDDDNDDEGNVQETNLYTIESSNKWSECSMNEMKEEMRKQMLYLALQNITSNETSSSQSQY